MSVSSLFLRDGVHVAEVGDDLVVLDVDADRYLCLPEAAAAARVAGRVLRCEDPGFARELASAGLLAAGPVGGPGEPPPPLPTDSLMPPPEVLERRDLPEVGRALIDLLRTYRGRSLGQLLATVRAGRAQLSSRQGFASLEAEVRRFHRWLPYAPAPSKCLLRSFMLLRLLHRKGLDATWVFGVSTWPFEAHCWLQVGAVALDEHPDLLAPFQPILAV